VQVDLEHFHAIVVAKKPSDDLAGDHLALRILAQSRLHSVADQGLDQEHLIARHARRDLNTWDRC
jgi:hypothetical protein